MLLDSVSVKEQSQRRDDFWFAMRQVMPHLVDDLGQGKIPQFCPPYREVVWCLPALFSGGAEYIELANRMITKYHDASSLADDPNVVNHQSQKFNIFQSNAFCELYNDYGQSMSESAREVVMWHVQQVPKTFKGSAQPDFVFRGCNDNMPAMATCGLVLAGQILDDKQAIEHARWNLMQLGNMLSRCAWMGEYNSPTYTPVTLRSMAKIVEVAQDTQIRDLALQIEHRLWAEVLLHFHPGTFQQAGPMSRAYAVNRAGHNYNLQCLLWYALGEELTGRDLIKSFFEPNGKQVIHFNGCPYQSAAEFCHLINTKLHLPDSLLHLVHSRQYPARIQGRSEQSRSCLAGAQVQTQTYMQQDYSLGTVNYPFVNAHQTCSLHLTYAWHEDVKTFQDAGTAFTCYRTDDLPYGQLAHSADGEFEGEVHTDNMSWSYAMQKDNVALMLCTPALTKDFEVNLLDSITTNTLKLQLVFSAHFGRVTSCCFDDPEDTIARASTNVSAVSLHAGQVFVHVQPLLPTQMQRQHAVRLVKQNEYDVLELINYEGQAKTFSCQDLQRVLNGLVITISDASSYPSLQAFHDKHNQARVVDYLFVGNRYVEYLRDDCWFKVVTSTIFPGVMTEMIDGLPCPKPIFKSNEMAKDQLPFLGKRCQPTGSFFPWDQMEIGNWRNSWIIGSRGLPGEKPYANCKAKLYPIQDGPRQ